MSKINEIQNAILQLGPGDYQKLLDMYLFERYSYDNITPRGMQVGTNKTVKGIPDSYVAHSDGKYTLIMYGTVQAQSFVKLKEDILKCLDFRLTGITLEQIKEIICCYTSTNLSPGEHSELIGLFSNVKLVGIGELSTDLCLKYQYIAKNMLSVVLDTDQILPISEFIRRHYQSPISTELSENLIGREDDIKLVLSELKKNDVVLIKGQSGIGKTNFALKIVEMFAKENNYELKCILSNGLSIYEDISVHFKDKNNTIVLIDDANALIHLSHIIRLTTNTSRNSNTKIVLTVRDYASQIVENEVLKYSSLYTYKLNELNNDDIKSIISSRFNFSSSDLINRVLNIASGNIRLAIMAGDAYNKQEYDKLDNVTDIYKKYYQDFANKMNNKDLTVATIIALYNVVQIKDEHNCYKLALKCGISESEFIESCYKLHKQEIVDIYQDLAVSFSNESLGNYLMYYLIYETKRVPIEEVTSLMYPMYKERLIYMFNTVVKLFQSQENIDFMCRAIKQIWDTRYKNSEMQAEFINSFQGLIPLEGLQYIKKEISKLNNEKINLFDYDFTNVNNNYITSNLISMLGIYKHSPYLKESTDLLLKHLNYIRDDNLMIRAYQGENFDLKRETAQDIFIFIKTNWTIDHNSHRNEYASEIELIEYLSDLYESKKDLNIGTILIWLCEMYLKFKFSHCEPDGNRTIIFSEFGLLPIDNLFELRKRCIALLKNLYSNTSLKSHVFKALLEYRPMINDNEANNDVIVSDFKEFEILIEDISFDLGFDECIVNYHYFTEARRVGVNAAKFRQFEKNQFFLSYLILSMSYRDRYLATKEIDYDEFIILKKDRISNLIDQYSISEWTKMFDFIHKKKSANFGWAFSEGVGFLLEEFRLRDTFLSIDFYKKILQNENDSWTITCIVKSIENQLGFENAFEFFDEPSFINSQILKTILILNTRSNKRKERLVKTLNFESDAVKKVIPIDKLFEICQGNTKVILEYVSKLESLSIEEPKLLIEFLSPLQNDNSELSSFFDDINSEEDNKKFQKIYLSALIYKSSFDFNNNILSFLLEKDNEFLHAYIEISLKNRIPKILTKLTVIWGMKNYIELADFIFERICELEKKERIYLSLGRYGTFIVDSPNCNKWIESYIDNRYNQIDIMKRLFNFLSDATTERRKLFVLRYLSLNKDISHFKQISILPMSQTFSGSRVPYIEKDIAFIKSILESLEGIDYLEHKVYFEDIIDSQRKEIQKVLYDEYLEHF